MSRLTELGLDARIESKRAEAGLGEFALGRVVAEHRESYLVVTEQGERTGSIKGAHHFRAVSREDYPAVGDWVAVGEDDGEHIRIEGTIPRRSVLKRRRAGSDDEQIIAANVDAVLIILAVGRDFSVNRAERYATAVSAGGARPLIVLNKADLGSTAEVDVLVGQLSERMPEVTVVSVSTVSDGGLDALAALLESGHTYCFVGSSGVGKSSIINGLLGREQQEVNAIGESTARGKHTTTARTLHRLDNGVMVIDNPGTREFGILDAEAGIDAVFGKVADRARKCRFSDCTHGSEPGCAVQAAIATGELDTQQLESYEKLSREREHHERSDAQRRRKDRAFGKFIKKVKGGIEKYK